jgi:hypothetical protein
MSDETHTKNYTEFLLPPSIVTKVDVSRLFNEIERVDNELIQLEAKEKVGATGAGRPVLSSQLEEFLAKNEINIDDGHQRKSLVHELRQLKHSLPVVHVTFSVMADGESLQKIVAWFREVSHPQTVIDVGLQPALVAGVHLRTTNRIHDLSLRKALDEHRDILTKELEALRVGQ